MFSRIARHQVNSSTNHAGATRGYLGRAISPRDLGQADVHRRLGALKYVFFKMNFEIINKRQTESNIIGTASHSPAFIDGPLTSNMIFRRPPSISEKYTLIELTVCFVSIVLVGLELEVDHFSKSNLGDFASMRRDSLVSCMAIGADTKPV